MYGQSVGNIMKSTMQYVMANYANDYASRIHAEEVTFHGDPVISLNPFTKPDYTIEDSLISFDPAVISVADEQVMITAKILNIGKAINDSISILVQHQLPDNTIEVLATRKIKATLYEDTIQVPLLINPLRHKGLNKIIVTIDQQNEVDELSETNNTVTKNFTVVDDELRPVFPYEYSIVGNSAQLALYASTANPLSPEKTYVMEMDTSRLFNSATKLTRTVTDSGGVIKFFPGAVLTDSTVYYWRVTTGPVSPSSRWLGSSFTYINGSVSDGFDQAHYFQYTDDEFESMNIDSASRKFNFDTKLRKLTIRTGLYPYYLYDVINVNVDNDQVDLYGCVYNSLQFVVYNPLTLKAWRNYNVTSTNGRFGSQKVCQNSATTDTTRAFFEFSFQNITSRTKAMQFIDSIPDGYFVSITNLGTTGNTSFVNTWKADTTVLGSGKSLWHKLHQQGLHQIDSFKTNLPFVFLFKKGDTINFPVRQDIGAAVNSHITDTFLLTGKAVTGLVRSPWFGPAKTWKDFKWDTTVASATNTSYFDIIGQQSNGDQSLLASVYNVKDTSLTFIDAAVYPKLQLRINNDDEQNAFPAQLKYWMLHADNYPEGALSPNLFFEYADTLNTVDSLRLKIAFKNISDVAFDSIKLRLTITGANGQEYVFNNLGNGARIKPLNPADTSIISYAIPLAGLAGNNELKLEVNPDNDQPEQFHFNNILYRDLYVINAACPGTGIVFSVAPFAGTLQWQVNTGAGFVNISDGPLYSGTNTTDLQISNAASNMVGYRYRCVYTAANTASFSTEFVLRFTALWTGLASTAWENPGNWNCGILPDATTDVIVKYGAPHYPVINSNAVCRSLSANPGTSVNIKTGFNLSLMGQ